MTQVTAVAPSDSQSFRRACGRFATGVTVITIRDGNGVRGTTANGFMSVSLTPPLLLVSINRATRTHRLLKQYRQFAVNVLSTAHEAWSDRFAGRSGDNQGNFEDVPHYTTLEGIPLLEGTVAVFICRVIAVHEAGDHSLFLSEAEYADYTPDAEPLLFYSGDYHDLSCNHSSCRCSLRQEREEVCKTIEDRLLP